MKTAATVGGLVGGGSVVGIATIGLGAAATGYVVFRILRALTR